ncbi:hypothetical protein AJ80_04359 [Polytolypa hystricis UAMH7299]|uniref:Protein PNS1 n=1 Tax=Polytolypa hystricis (strain UAMH7299) TaxID=1447883 RepID=A0A2B7YAZ3_POLH7|nr:hypothetical protein AJ80_04359 [Polytolypa hystricis UAMH7299]
MTLDSALLYRPTESLVQLTHPKFFPFRIPNSHHQLRHYISTADPDRIYVAVERVIYAIHVSSRKREVVTIVPFEPRCLTSGLGWIAVGGADNGDCAFIRIGNPPLSSTDGAATPSQTDVDTPLPLDIESILRRLPSWAPEVQIHEFGGSIVNSVTLHRLPGDNDIYADEDVAILSNNDKTVSVYSLTQSEVLETLRHPVAMNYSIISPDSKILAAVGDENRVHFYRAVPNPKRRIPAPNGNKMLRGWEFPLIRVVDLDADSLYDDRCCFTITFSPSSHLCAVGSQAGVITVFDAKGILDTYSEDKTGREDILCVFRSSRPQFEGGAVRCMAFAPRPWDLLVWVEDYGRAGIADMRQAFSRRQILNLDVDGPSLEHVALDSLGGASQPGGLDLESEGRSHRHSEFVSDVHALIHGLGRLIRILEDATSRRRQARGDAESESLREDLIQDLTDRERQIIDFLNSSRWASSIEEGSQPIPQSRLPRVLSPLPPSDSPPTGQGNQSPLSFPPPNPERTAGRSDQSRDNTSDRVRPGQPRRRNSVVLSQDNTTPTSNTTTTSTLAPHPTITFRWSQSPSQIAPTDDSLDAAGSNTAGPSGATSGTDSGQSNGSATSGSYAHDRARARVLFGGSPSVAAGDNQGQRQRGSRPRSIPRRSERIDIARALNSELRTTLAAERLRLQRQAAVQESHRLSQWEQQYRRLVDLDQTRSPRWIRGGASDLAERHIAQSSRNREKGVGTAGIGWGAEGRTLYIGTVEGILQYEVNIQDRKTFPGFSWNRYPRFNPTFGLAGHQDPPTFRDTFQIRNPKFHDKWAGVLFVLTWLGLAGLSGYVIQQYLQENRARPIPVPGPFDSFSMHKPTALLLIFVLTIAFWLSMAYLLVAQYFPQQFIWIAGIMNVLLALGSSVYYVIRGHYGCGITFMAFGVVASVYFISWIPRIRFSAAMLEETAEAGRKGVRVLLMSTIAGLFAVVFAAWVSITIGAIFVAFEPARDGTNPSCNGKQCSSAAVIGLVAFATFAGYWISEWIKNTVYTAAAGFYGNWYFCDRKYSPLPRDAASGAFWRATTYSFGSICFGSLIVAIFNAFRQVCSFGLPKKLTTRVTVVGKIVSCMAGWLTDFVRWSLQFINRYAFVQIALFGGAYIPAAQASWTMLKDQGVDAMINDCLVGPVLTMGSVFVAYACVLSSYLYMQFADLPYNFDGHFTPVVMGFSFLIGFQVGQIFLTPFGSGVDTLFFGMARDPQIVVHEQRALWGAVKHEYAKAEEILNNP